MLIEEAVDNTYHTGFNWFAVAISMSLQCPKEYAIPKGTSNDVVVHIRDALARAIVVTVWTTTGSIGNSQGAFSQKRLREHTIGHSSIS